jgi:hypothetical protein
LPDFQFVPTRPPVKAKSTSIASTLEDNFATFAFKTLAKLNNEQNKVAEKAKKTILAEKVIGTTSKTLQDSKPTEASRDRFYKYPFCT